MQIKHNAFFAGIFTFLLGGFFLLSGCIGNDIIMDTVDEVVKIMNPIDSLKLGDAYAFEALYLNNVGKEESQTIVWSSSDPEIISISPTGSALGEKIGIVDITATVSLAEKTVMDKISVVVGENTTISTPTERTGELQTTSSYTLEGTFTLKPAATGTDLVLEFQEDYKASAGLPGLYIYLTNNPSTNSGAYEIGKVEVFSGAHSYTLPSSVDINAFSHILMYCKPFSVKVGDGEFEN